MPISIEVRARSGLIVTRYEGHVSEEEHREAFERFFTGGGWVPDVNELAIASEARSSSISYRSLRDLTVFKNQYYAQHGVTHLKVAIYAPGDLAFGIARMYDMITDESPEEVRAFRDIREAIRWLRE